MAQNERGRITQALVFVSIPGAILGNPICRQPLGASSIFGVPKHKASHPKTGGFEAGTWGGGFGF